MKVTFLDKEQDYQNETTQYWFELEEETELGNIFAIYDTNGRLSLIAENGESLEEWYDHDRIKDMLVTEYEIMNNMKNYTWNEVKEAVNYIEKRHNPRSHSVEFVKDVCNNNLPFAIVQVLALDCVDDIRDEYTKIAINGFNQLQEKGCIGEENSNSEK